MNYRKEWGNSGYGPKKTIFFGNFANFIDVFWQAPDDDGVVGDYMARESNQNVYILPFPQLSQSDPWQ